MVLCWCIWGSGTREFGSVNGVDNVNTREFGSINRGVDNVDTREFGSINGVDKYVNWPPYNRDDWV